MLSNLVNGGYARLLHYYCCYRHDYFLLDYRLLYFGGPGRCVVAVELDAVAAHYRVVVAELDAVAVHYRAVAALDDLVDG
jgi:hypothetical protein